MLFFKNHGLFFDVYICLGASSKSNLGALVKFSFHFNTDVGLVEKKSQIIPTKRYLLFLINVCLEYVQIFTTLTYF